MTVGGVGQDEQLLEVFTTITTRHHLPHITLTQDIQGFYVYLWINFESKLLMNGSIIYLEFGSV